MTTKLAGGRITGHIGLTLEATNALAVGDPVHITATYTCVKADGSKPVVGQVTVANKKRVAGAYPADDAPGDVSVDAHGFAVQVFKSVGALATAGIKVGIDVNGKVAVPGANVQNIGVLLSTATGANQDVDVLVGCY